MARENVWVRGIHTTIVITYNFIATQIRVARQARWVKRNGF